MSAYLQPAVLDPSPSLDITDEEFLLLKHSRAVLNAAFSFEENYDLLIGNYLELENSALSLVTTTVARRLREYQEMFEIKAELNRRAVNFLSSARLFVDQIQQRVGVCGGDKDEIKNKLRTEYDLYFEFRFMEALRNHVQHSGSAVHGFEIGGTWTPSRIRNEFVPNIYTEKHFLALDTKFKDTVLKECPNKVDLLAAARRYLESLSAVHELARSSISSSIAEARSVFEAAIKKYAEFSGGSVLTLTAYDSSSIHHPSNEIAIFLDWDDVRLKLSTRNKHLINFSKNVISTVAS